MPLLVNGQIVSEQTIREESERIERDRQWHQIAGAEERARRLREAAELSAIYRTLLEQAALGDPKPVDGAVVDREVARMKEAGGCRGAFDDGLLRAEVERRARLERTARDFAAGAARPSAAQPQYVAAFQAICQAELYYLLGPGFPGSAHSTALSDYFAGQSCSGASPQQEVIDMES